MRLLPSVSANVNAQGTALDEALATTWNRARVWALVRVYPVVSLQVWFAVKTLGERVSTVAPRPVSRQLAFLHESQSHRKRRVAGSYSTSSRSSIVADESSADLVVCKCVKSETDGLRKTRQHMTRFVQDYNSEIYLLLYHHICRAMNRCSSSTT
jgi:hypothetical protein